MEGSCLLSQKTVLIILLKNLTCFFSTEFLNECFYSRGIVTYLTVI